MTRRRRASARALARATGEASMEVTARPCSARQIPLLPSPSAAACALRPQAGSQEGLDVGHPGHGGLHLCSRIFEHKYIFGRRQPHGKQRPDPHHDPRWHFLRTPSSGLSWGSSVGRFHLRRARGGVARETAVDTRRRSGRSAVVPVGLSIGDKVVLFPPGWLKDGASVKIREVR